MATSLANMVVCPTANVAAVAMGTKIASVEHSGIILSIPLVCSSMSGTFSGSTGGIRGVRVAHVGSALPITY